MSFPHFLNIVSSFAVKFNAHYIKSVFYEGEAVYLSPEQKQALRLWSYLTDEQQMLASKFLVTMK